MVFIMYRGVDSDSLTIPKALNIFANLDDSTAHFMTHYLRQFRPGIPVYDGIPICRNLSI